LGVVESGVALRLASRCFDPTSAGSPVSVNQAKPVSLVISIKDQRLGVLKEGRLTKTFPISTAVAGVGERMDASTTPRGLHEVAEKIGQDAPIGTVFADRIPTGEVMIESQPGRWPVTTRILWLGGLEEKNRNTIDRYIYIHGTPVERLLGAPASGGCIRMRAVDVIEVFSLVDVGSVVYISEESLEAAATEMIAGKHRSFAEF
jgi:lipoprotein-anchoring transpeptidase ErfK/SrfK